MKVPGMRSTRSRRRPRRWSRLARTAVPAYLAVALLASATPLCPNGIAACAAAILMRMDCCRVATQDGGSPQLRRVDCCAAQRTDDAPLRLTAVIGASAAQRSADVVAPAFVGALLPAAHDPTLAAVHPLLRPGPASRAAPTPLALSTTLLL